MIVVAGLLCIIVAMAKWISYGFLCPRQTTFSILSNVILVADECDGSESHLVVIRIRLVRFAGFDYRDQSL